MAQKYSNTGMDVGKQNQLKRYFVMIIAVLVIAIFVGQLYQDFHRKQEHLHAKRIHAYQNQTVLVSELMNEFLVLRDYDEMNIVLRDATSNKLSHTVKNLIVIQDQLLEYSRQYHLKNYDEALAEEEFRLIDFVNELTNITMDVLASIEAKTITTAYIEHHYQQYLSVCNDYQNESVRFIDNLSAYLEDESQKNRLILWGVVIVIALLVILVGFVLYRFVSVLVNREFSLLNEENRLRKENEDELRTHTQLLTDQKMKMKSILDSTVDSIITITAKGHIDSFNKAAEAMFGYPAEFVIGKNINMLMPEPYATEHDSYLQNYQETQEKKIIGIGRSVVGKRVDGTEFPIYLSVGEIAHSEPKLFTGIIQDITQWKKANDKLHETMAELRQKQDILENEEQIARHVFENIVASNNDTLPELSSWCVPMGTFSGDMMLSSLLPSGALRVLLCDFTGHGLPAALGAVPVSTIHRAMAQKGLPLPVLVTELNNRLKDLLPTGIFCCITAIDVDVSRTHAQMINAGLPEILIVNQAGEIKQRIKSDHLPLGVIKYEDEDIKCIDVELELGDVIYTYSDGLTEAENEEGKMLGQASFERLLTVESDENGRLVDIRNSVGDYMGKAKATDDISLVEIKTLS